MTEVCLAYMAHDVHELGCHFVARHAGLYERHGLEPDLLDARSAGGALPERCFRAACAATLSAWLSGADDRVVLVAAERPMFWLYGAAGVQELSGLRGKTIAAYPPTAPPAVFLRHLLAQAGISDAKILPAADDETRVELLQAGNVAAALLSSRVAPGGLQGSGLEPLVFLGDELGVATTGLAVTAKFCAEDPGLVTAMCACFQQALELIHGDHEVLTGALRAGAKTVAGSVDRLAPVIRACYTHHGRSSAEHLQGGAVLMAAAIGAELTRPVDQLYDFSYLGHST